MSSFQESRNRKVERRQSGLTEGVISCWENMDIVAEFTLSYRFTNKHLLHQHHHLITFLRTFRCVNSKSRKEHLQSKTMMMTSTQTYERTNARTQLFTLTIEKITLVLKSTISSRMCARVRDKQTFKLNITRKLAHRRKKQESKRELNWLLLLDRKLL